MPVEPQFIREREAWYKAGSSKMLTYSIITVILFDIVIGALSAWYKVGAYQTVVLTILSTLAGLAAAHQWIEIQARAIAKKGGVSVDQH